MKTSIVILTEIDTLSDANALCTACGWGADNLRVELSADGAGPATHLGLHAMAQEGFVAALADALDTDHALAASLIASTRADADRWGHFDAVTNAAGLLRVEPAVEG